jgi:hypothetical protein
MNVEFRDFDLTEKGWIIETKRKLEYSRKDLATRFEIDKIEDYGEQDREEADAMFEAQRRTIFVREHLMDHVLKCEQDHNEVAVTQEVRDFHKKRYELANLTKGSEIPDEMKRKIDEIEYHRPTAWEPKPWQLQLNDYDDEVTVNEKGYNGNVSILDIVSPVNGVRYTDHETKEWSRRSTWELPQIGNCVRCFAHGPLEGVCEHCQKKWLKCKAGYIMIDNKKTYIGWHFLHVATRGDRDERNDIPELEYHERSWKEKDSNPEFEVNTLGIYKALWYNQESLEWATERTSAKMEEEMWRRAYTIAEVMRLDSEILKQWNDRSVLDILKDIRSQVNERLETVNMKKMIPVVNRRSGARGTD